MEKGAAGIGGQRQASRSPARVDVPDTDRLFTDQIAMRWLLSLLIAVCAASARADEPPWAAPMKQVHAKFTGKAGTFAQFGDSITVTMAYWSALRYEHKNLDPA